MSTDRSQHQDRAARLTKLTMQQAAADFIRRLPEFQTRNEERINRVSRKLAEALSATTRQ